MAGESTTYGELVARARKSLDDMGHGPNVAVRWTDAQLLAFAHDGMAALERIRPAIRYVGMRLVSRNRADGASAPAMLDDHYQEAVVEYILYKALQMDETDAGPAYRSNMHHKRFEEIARS